MFWRSDWGQIWPRRLSETAGVAPATWKEWTRAFDTLGAAAMVHKDIARYLKDEEDVPPCWAQTVTVGDERILGLGDQGQHRS